MRVKDIVKLIVLRYYANIDKCFTYQDLRIYTYGNGYRVEWHSVERYLRELSREGILSKMKVGKKVKFCLDR